MIPQTLFRDSFTRLKAVRSGEFKKLFPHLPPFDHGNPADIRERLLELGKFGGIMDAKDPRITGSNPLEGNPQNEDNPNAAMTVGFTFLGQFIDHDLTLDASPIEGPPINVNFRSPALDLDSVYGEGPDLDRYLYKNEMEFLIDNAAPGDLPRNSFGTALIGDGRNDENVMISQLHLAFLKFHNRVVEVVTASIPLDQINDRQNKPREIFQRSQQLVRWHYQWIVVHQFLAATVEEATLNGLLDGSIPPVFPQDEVFMPLEFSVAAYRFGHSQIRPGYQPNPGFGGPIFDPTISMADSDPDDMRGGTRAPRRFVNWNVFFDFGDVGSDGQPTVKKNKKIDILISTPMFLLPASVGLPEPSSEFRTLAGRNLLRQHQRGLASGQAIADELGVQPLDPADLAILGDPDFIKDTPLWFYVLREAEVLGEAERLGPVGSRIVAGTIIGLLQKDPGSFLNQPGWKPTLPRRAGQSPGDFDIQDFLEFARASIR